MKNYFDIYYLEKFFKLILHVTKPHKDMTDLKSSLSA